MDAAVARARDFRCRAGVAEDKRRMAYEELLIAEGSDWCWWYGPEHESANRPEFDQLYRSHLANVYRFLGLMPPEELSRPILRMTLPAVLVAPSGPIRPVIDGEVTSYFEWMGAGVYRVDERSGSMHGKKFLVKEVYFGSDGLEPFSAHRREPGFARNWAAWKRASASKPRMGRRPAMWPSRWRRGARATEQNLAIPAAVPHSVECAFVRVLELRVSLASLGIAPGGGLRFQCSLWQGGLPIDAVPAQGWVEMRTTDPEQWDG